MSSTPLSSDSLLQRLYAAPRLRAAQLLQVPKIQGVYTWWADDLPTVCLKVGRARLGARGEGLLRRIRQHLSSNPDNTVLARHLAGEGRLAWAAEFDLTLRSDRQRFLATRCTFQVLALPDLTEEELDEIESYVEQQLEPRFIDYVRA